MFRSYRARAVICMGALLSLLFALPTGIPVTSPAFADDASVGISSDASAGAQVEAGNNAGDPTVIDQPSSTDTSASDSTDSNNADSAYVCGSRPWYVFPNVRPARPSCARRHGRFG